MDQKFGSQEAHKFESKMVISACLPMLQMLRVCVKTPAKREHSSVMESWREGSHEATRRFEDPSAG